MLPKNFTDHQSLSLAYIIWYVTSQQIESNLCCQRILMFYNDQYLVLGYTSITNKWHLLYRCFVYYLKCMSIYSSFKSYTLVPYVPHNLLSLQPVRAF